MYHLLIALLAGLAWVTAAYAEEDPAVPPPKPDCRYLKTENPEAAEGAGTWDSQRFPQDDVFRPLLADPKQPRFQASYQRLRLRDRNDSIDAGFVGFGENFGLWTKRKEKGCDGIQASIFGAVFAEFNLNERSQ